MTGTGITTSSGGVAHDDASRLVDDMLKGMGDFVVEATLRNIFPSHLTSDDATPTNALTPAQERIGYVVQRMHHAVDALRPFSGPNPNWSAFEERSDRFGFRAVNSVERLVAVTDQVESLTPAGEELVAHANAAARMFVQALGVVTDNIKRIKEGQALSPNFDVYYLEGVRRVEQAAKLLTPSSTEPSS